LMAKLTDIGFMKGAVAETIVSTYNADGSSNAAPMGVTMTDEQHLAINLYKSSTTLFNIKAGRCAVVNLTGDINVYYRTAFKEANRNGALPREWFVKAETVNAPKLRSAEATVDVSVADLSKLDQEKTRATFTVTLVQATPQYPKVYCRAFGATVEAIIHATRVRALVKHEAERERVGELLRRIQICGDIVSHVAPGSAYALVMADLTKRIAVWDQK